MINAGADLNRNLSAGCGISLKERQRPDRCVVLTLRRLDRLSPLLQKSPGYGAADTSGENKNHETSILCTSYRHPVCRYAAYGSTAARATVPATIPTGIISAAPSPAAGAQAQIAAGNGGASKGKNGAAGS